MTKGHPKEKQTILSAQNLCKSFVQGDNTVCAIKNINFDLLKGESVSIVGPSGCGKTTLLQILGLLRSADSGKVIVNGQNYSRLDENQRTECRRKSIGFVYQAHNLLSDFNALENVSLPLILKGIEDQEAYAEAKKLLKLLGLERRYGHFPTALSGGEQQRVAIARSLIHNPDIILADEPTGNLDSGNSRLVVDVLMNLVKEKGISLVVVTHNEDIARKTDRRLVLKGGSLN